MQDALSLALRTRQQDSVARGWLTIAVSLLLQLVISACGGGGGGPPAPIIPIVVAPSVVTQRAVASVTAGQPAAFTVTVAGTPPLTINGSAAVSTSPARRRRRTLSRRPCSPKTLPRIVSSSETPSERCSATPQS